MEDFFCSGRERGGGGEEINRPAMIQPPPSTKKSRYLSFEIVLFSQLELLFELENSLPEWIVRRANVDRFTDYPNSTKSLVVQVKHEQRIL